MWIVTHAIPEIGESHVCNTFEEAVKKGINMKGRYPALIIYRGQIYPDGRIEWEKSILNR